MSLVACTSSSSGTPLEEKARISEFGASEAIKIALQSQIVGQAVIEPDLFPDYPGTAECVIHAGGDYPPPRLSGLCQTSASQELPTKGWKLTFTEFWDGSQYYGHLPGVRFHSWSFLVGLDRAVGPSTETGDPAPQDAI